MFLAGCWSWIAQWIWGRELRGAIILPGQFFYG